MRLGVFGGTFDPVHLGHLILAEQCLEQGKLDRVLFIPAARPPHKQEQALTPFHQRVEMLTFAIAGHPGFAIDELERDRPGPSYTVVTLEELAKKYPGAELLLIVGADSLQDFPTWYSPARIAELASFLVVPRPGCSHGEIAGVRQQVIDSPLIDISSRDLRRRVAEGRSIRFMVPRAVEVYISEKGLYRAS